MLPLTFRYDAWFGGIIWENVLNAALVNGIQLRAQLIEGLHTTMPLSDRL